MITAPAPVVTVLWMVAGSTFGQPGAESNSRSHSKYRRQYTLEYWRRNMPPLLRHRTSTDVAIQVLRKHYIQEKQLYKLKVRWWNIGKCHRPWDMGIEQKIVLSRKQIVDWIYIDRLE